MHKQIYAPVYNLNKTISKDVYKCKKVQQI